MPEAVVYVMYMKIHIMWFVHVCADVLRSPPVVRQAPARVFATLA